MRTYFRSGVLILLTLWSLFAISATKDYIPKQAFQYFPMIQNEAEALFPDYTETAYYAALIEHESCISLTHSKCWNPASELKTAREQGVGFGQITRAYRKDGSVRMDALTAMKNRYQQSLKDLSWSNVKQRPDLQVRIMILMIRDLHKGLYMVKDIDERRNMADAAYNGGPGDLKKERMTCGLAKDCDPQKWFGHVEKYCVKNKNPLYGQRSACDINRHHVHDVVYNNLPKYLPYFH